MDRHLRTLLERLDTRLGAVCAALRERRCVAGFDGYVDRLYRVVERRTGSARARFLPTIESFARRLLSSGGASADLEIVPCSVRPGGNAPLFSAGIAALGVRTACIGHLGLRRNRERGRGRYAPISVGEPCETTALEFGDGKVMLGDLSNAHALRWRTIVERVGLRTLRDMFRRADLVAVLNWSAVRATDEILHGLRRDIFSGMPPGCLRRKRLFVDLADPSARPLRELTRFLALLRTLQRAVPVVLGLNRNEARRVLDALGQPGARPVSGTAETARTIRERLGLAMIVVHTSRESAVASENGIARCPALEVRRPVQLTGAGDHFSAGFCAGLLAGLPQEQCLALANLAAALYIENGAAPCPAHVRGRLRTILARKET